MPSIACSVSCLSICCQMCGCLPSPEEIDGLPHLGSRQEPTHFLLKISCFLGKAAPEIRLEICLLTYYILDQKKREEKKNPSFLTVLMINDWAVSDDRIIWKENNWDFSDQLALEVNETTVSFTETAKSTTSPGPALQPTMFWNFSFISQKRWVQIEYRIVLFFENTENRKLWKKVF